jgi:YebC/PmpR family DNA-binding regulatory protein
MAGHSKWAQIKYKKALTDAKKSQIFSKLAALISVAAREKGGDPAANPKLRMAIEKAREMNMPQDNINRAIKRGTGELPGAVIEEALYEGYGPGGAAVLVEVVTDNKNRTLGELRKIFTEHGGKLGESGSAQWMFTRTPTAEGGIEYLPKAPLVINDPETVRALRAFFTALDDQQDVKEIYSNATLPPSEE